MRINAPVLLHSIVILSISILLPLSSSLAQARCFDSDSGNAPGVKGYIQYRTAQSGSLLSLSDSCVNGALEEYICVKSGTTNVAISSNITGEFSKEIIPCEWGCLDGLCKTKVAGCNDSDPTNNPNLKGTVAIVGIAPALLVQRTQKDICDSTGKRVQQFQCTSGSIVSAGTANCENGCVDGACVVQSVDNEGCFIKVTVTEVPSADKTKSVFTFNRFSTTIGKHFGSLRLKSIEGETGITFETYNSAKVTLQQYALHPGIYGLAEDFKGNAEIIVSDRAERDLYVPYNINIAGVRIRSNDGRTIEMAIPNGSLICGRECIGPNKGASITNTDQRCCPGTTPKFFNSTSFVCRACGASGLEPCPSVSATPLPTVSPVPVRR